MDGCVESNPRVETVLTIINNIWWHCMICRKNVAARGLVFSAGDDCCHQQLDTLWCSIWMSVIHFSGDHVLKCHQVIGCWDNWVNELDVSNRPVISWLTPIDSVCFIWFDSWKVLTPDDMVPTEETPLYSDKGFYCHSSPHSVGGESLERH